MRTKSRYYRSPSPNYSDSVHTTDFGLGLDTDKASKPISTLNTSRRLRIWCVGTFDKKEDDPRSMVRNRFSGRAGSISLLD